MSIDDILSLLREELGEHIIKEVQESVIQDSLLIEKEDLLNVCTVLHKHEQLYIDFLSSITAQDNGEKIGTIDVVYHLLSLVYEHNVTLKVSVLRGTKSELPIIPSVTSIWAAANWHEREAYDLVGVKFKGHPDLRRILLPTNWEGHPLRKDYKEQEYYHGVKVKY